MSDMGVLLAGTRAEFGPAKHREAGDRSWQKTHKLTDVDL